MKPCAKVALALVVVYLAFGAILAGMDSTNHTFTGQVSQPDSSGNWPITGSLILVVAWPYAVLKTSTQG